MAYSPVKEKTPNNVNCVLFLSCNTGRMLEMTLLHNLTILSQLFSNIEWFGNLNDGQFVNSLYRAESSWFTSDSRCCNSSDTTRGTILLASADSFPHHMLTGLARSLTPKRPSMYLTYSGFCNHSMTMIRLYWYSTSRAREIKGPRVSFWLEQNSSLMRSSQHSPVAHFE